MDKVDRLMDILTSKCIIKPCAEANCSYVCLSCIHISYACSREKKIPTNDLAFIKDQRERIRTFGPRQIGSVDIPETRRLVQQKERQKKRREAEENRTLKNEKQSIEDHNHNFGEQSSKDSDR